MKGLTKGQKVEFEGNENIANLPQKLGFNLFYKGGRL